MIFGKEMTKTNDPRFLEAKKEYGNKTSVAFIGRTYDGKTVVSTLLYDAIFNHFYPKNKDKVNVRPVKGTDKLVTSHKRMFLKGRFPPPTLPGSRSEIVVRIASKSSLGPKIDLMLKDASGEDLTKILQRGDKTDEELLTSVLTEGLSESESESYGPLSYLPFVKLYVLLIDCEAHESWISEQYNYAKIINSLNQLKKITKEVDKQGRFKSAIAIVFTKVDKLPLHILKPQGKKITPKEIVANKLHALESTISDSHDGKIAYFMMSVDKVNDATPEEAVEIAKEEFEELSLQMENSELEEREITKHIIEQKIDDRVQTKINETRQQQITAGQPADAAEKQAQSAGNTERQIAEKELTIDEELLEKQNILDRLKNPNKKYYTITLPLKYSAREYIKFISWIHEVLTE